MAKRKFGAHYTTVKGKEKWWKDERGVVSTKCNRKAFTKKLNETRRVYLKIPADMRPLFKHVINLAKDSFAVGACKRAGRELLHARRLIKYAK